MFFSTTFLRFEYLSFALIFAIPTLQQSMYSDCLDLERRDKLIKTFVQLQSSYRCKEVASLHVFNNERSVPPDCDSLIKDDIHAFYNTQAQTPLHITRTNGSKPLEKLLGESVLEIHGNKIMILIWSTYLNHQRFHQANIINPFYLMQSQVNRFRLKLL
jgi:hypothetical protein